MSDEPNSTEFRKTIGLFATGVTVVAAETRGEIHAMTANAVTSLSLDPLLLIVCVGKKARMMDFLKASGVFSINVLREDQRALSTYFAGGWQQDVPPPFRFVHWEKCPRLEGCLASLGCELHEILDGGDHWIVVGRVVALHQGIEPRNPLLFYEGRYGRIDTTKREPAPDIGWVETPVLVFYDPWKQDI